MFDDLKKAGPLNHDQLSSWNGNVPRLGMSAGFKGPGTTCFHHSGDVVSWISATRLATKVFHVAEGFLIHVRVVLESVQRVTDEAVGTREARIFLNSLLNSRAPQSSRRGIETLLSGATRVLEHKRRMKTSPLSLSDRIYRHAA